MFDSRFLAFLLLAGVLTLTPGADTMLALRNAIARGKRGGLWTVVGIGTGFFVQPMLAALGLAAILVRSKVAFDIVKWAGSLYLAYLGVQSLRGAVTSWRARKQIPESNAKSEEPGLPGFAQPDDSPGACFRQGLLTNALNPKIGVFYFAILPQFLKSGDPVFAKSLLMAASHYVMGMLWLSGLVLLAARVRGLFARPAVRIAMDALSGFVLIGFGIRLAAARAKG